MGAYCPVPASIISYRQAVKIQAIAQKTIAGIKTEGTPYKGVLYIGLMLAKERGGDPVVIEYNARFGDPEAQVLLTSMQKSGVDVADLLLSAAREDISHFAVPPSITTAVTVAVATSGYPDNPRKGDEIFGLDKQYPDVIVQQAGTAMDGDKIVTSGGRVLYVTGTGDSVLAASKAAYGALGRQGIHFKDMHYRTDIAWQALER
jgi:phosphoribosylamine--glycine ligase